MIEFKPGLATTIPFTGIGVILVITPAAAAPNTATLRGSRFGARILAIVFIAGIVVNGVGIAAPGEQTAHLLGVQIGDGFAIEG